MAASGNAAYGKHSPLQALACTSALALTLSLAGRAAPANAASYVSFDVPGASVTVPLAINAGGSVTGYYTGPSADGQYGFIRTPDGTIETFGRKDRTFNWPWSINGRGAVTGWFAHRRYARGFLRRNGGNVRRFNFPAARSTEGTAINEAGAIAGDYIDSSFATHGFVRAADGTMTGFDPQGSRATQPTAIDRHGDIGGWYVDASDVQNGFLRDASGSFTTFVVDDTDTTVRAINDRGQTAGYIGSEESSSTGFIREADGSIVLVEPTGCSVDSVVNGINAAGATTGYCIAADSATHGFVRARNGRYKVFDPPNATQTFAYGINDSGAIAGAYYDSSGLHGFIRTP